MSKVLRIADDAKKLLYSYAEMHTYGLIKIEANKSFIPTDYRTNYNYGAIYCDIQNGKIVIPPNSADYIRVSGYIGGNGSTQAFISVYNDENNVAIATTLSLYQPTGNKYVSGPITSKVIKIPDKSKTYYVKMTIIAYNTDFTLNDGFGSEASYICVEKII